MNTHVSVRFITSLKIYNPNAHERYYSNHIGGQTLGPMRILKNANGTNLQNFKQLWLLLRKHNIYRFLVQTNMDSHQFHKLLYHCKPESNSLSINSVFIHIIFRHLQCSLSISSHEITLHLSVAFNSPSARFYHSVLKQPLALPLPFHLQLTLIDQHDNINQPKHYASHYL